MSKTKNRGTYVNHADHSHPQTKPARARCKRSIEETGQPWDGVERDPVPGTPEFDALPRGRKAAITRRRNEGMRESTEAVDTLLAASSPLEREAAASVALDRDPDSQTISLPGEVTVGDPLRDAKGQFTKATLARWQLLIDQMDDARSYVETNGIELLGATLVTSLGGQKFVAEFDGDEWVVTAE